MGRLACSNVKFTIVPQSAEFIIGSNTIKTPADLYVLNVSNITSEDNKRKKRLFDVGFAIALLLMYVFVFWFVRRPMGLLKNIFLVLFSRKTWVGYCKQSKDEMSKLPVLKSSVLTITDVFSQEQLERNTIHKLNLLYASNYSIGRDVSIIGKAFKELGR
jgi:lipopolysaccharide/colanic/teichoic acid biosynthesis glycosyltransferase